jgi:hypothetical protein
MKYATFIVPALNIIKEIFEENKIVFEIVNIGGLKESYEDAMKITRERMKKGETKSMALIGEGGKYSIVEKTKEKKK